jgi:hypothetical protein
MAHFLAHGLRAEAWCISLGLSSSLAYQGFNLSSWGCVGGVRLFELLSANGKRYHGFTNIVQDDDKCVLGLLDAARDYVDAHKLDNATFFTR